MINKFAYGALARKGSADYIPDTIEKIDPDVLDFPLIAPKNTAKNLETKNVYGENIYFGTGVVSSKAISQGLPFDVFGMLLTAEWMRRKTNAQGIIHEISDIHALLRPEYDPKEIAALANGQKLQLTRIASALGLGDVYRCVLASEYRDQKIFKEVQNEVDCLCADNVLPYMRYQSAGNLYFARFEGVRCKVGWLIDDNNNNNNNKLKGLDERSFNDVYDELGVEPLCFAYTWSGWNFDPRRARVSPYTTVSGEKRLMLDSNEPVTRELLEYIVECSDKKVSRYVVMHLARIISAFDVLYGENEDQFWQNKVNARQVIKLPKAECWMCEKYVDILKLALRIEELRALKNPLRSVDCLCEEMQRRAKFQALHSFSKAS